MLTVFFGGFLQRAVPSVGRERRRQLFDLVGRRTVTPDDGENLGEDTKVGNDKFKGCRQLPIVTRRLRL